MKQTYYQEFCQEYGITDENNSFPCKYYDMLASREIKCQKKIFKEDRHGNIDILVWDINRNLFMIDAPNANPLKDAPDNNRERAFTIKRLAQPLEVVGKDGEVTYMKYVIPKGMPTKPFLPPALVDKYERKEQIKTLVLTEGYKKAFYASIYGLDVVGLPSITCYKEKETEALYSDILTIINSCEVKNIIMLYDGDCRDISQKAINHEKDLYTRPSSFYNSAANIHRLLNDLDVNFFFAHVNSENIPGTPKGLDDLLLTLKGAERIAIDELLTLSAKTPTQYFVKKDISKSPKKLSDYFRFNGIENFYSFHADQIKLKEFIYKGTRYVFNEREQKLDVIMPAELHKYFRVGDIYYKYVEIPDQYMNIEKRYYPRQSGTIKIDLGDNAKHFSKIVAYEAFCNVPNHVEYTQVIHNCYNLYCPFEWTAEGGDCSATLDFIRHIFGEQYELGLDYIQLLYQRPTQILPILCMVSTENQTGKSTFIKWLKDIFTRNCAIIGNGELADKFNGPWASKLLIACEETFIEKQPIVEKIKSLSTSDKVFINMKNKDHDEIGFFGKFIFASNNEDGFIRASSDDIRYWIRKVPRIENVNVRLLDTLKEEIPAFLYYLNNRKLSTKNESRMWFAADLLVTDALRKLVEASRPSLEKTLRFKIRELFIDTDRDTLEFSIPLIKEYFSIKEEETYIEKILTNMHIDKYRNAKNNVDSKTIQIPWHDSEGNIVWKSYRCRPYIFRRETFITELNQS